MKRIVALLLSLFCSPPGNAAPAERLGVRNEPVEWAYRTQQKYSDPFNDVEVNVIFTKQGGREWKVPAFWAGGTEWKVRFAPPETGLYKYRVESTDKGNPDLNGQEGALRVAPYEGNNPLLAHGSIRVSQNRRYLEHMDGTPFFWLGDTWWKGLSRRISVDEFKTLAEDRHQKGFTVIQIVAGLYPDEPPFDPRGNNEGGFAWERGFARINPAYFDHADRRIQLLVQSELVPAIVSCWGYYLPWTGVEKMKKHWRNLLARYGAYPVVWILAGEGTMAYYLSAHPQKDRAEQKVGWTALAKYLRSIDPYHHPITMHPNTSGRAELGEDDALDIDMLQTGHGGWRDVPRHIGLVTSSYSKTPPMPVVLGEMDYEGHQQINWQEMQRFAFWSTMINGAAGFTYGAGGIWEMNGKTESHGPSPWGITGNHLRDHPVGRSDAASGIPAGGHWQELGQQQWWRFEPHPEWVEPHGTAFLKRHSEWFDVTKRWAAEKGEFLLPYTAGIPGEIRVVYIPGRIYDPLGPLVTNLEPDITYQAAYVNPITGEKKRIGSLARPETTRRFSDSFQPDRKPEWIDRGEKTTAKDGELAAAKSAWTVVTGLKEADVIAAVDAHRDTEAGLLVRVQDSGDCIMAVYSPSMKGIWIHERQNGEYGPRLGFTAVPDIDRKMHMVAEVHGDIASLTIADGKRIFRTAPVKVTERRAGTAGVWTEPLACEGGRFGGCTTAGGDQGARPGQVFENFLVQVIDHIPTDANENIVVLNAWRAPLLPVSHDWLLVLER
jgi:hypothetical protein